MKQQTTYIAKPLTLLLTHTLSQRTKHVNKFNTNHTKISFLFAQCVHFFYRRIQMKEIKKKHRKKAIY